MSFVLVNTRSNSSNFLLSDAPEIEKFHWSILHQIERGKFSERSTHKETQSRLYFAMPDKNNAGAAAVAEALVHLTTSSVLGANASGANTSANGSTGSPPLQVQPYEITQEVWLRAILIFLYTVIFILGISGNLLVVYVVVRNKSMQTITNIFITNLAVSDIMMCLLAVPFTPLSAFLKSWVFGDALCHIVPMTLGVSVYVSTLTSTAIAIDR